MVKRKAVRDSMAICPFLLNGKYYDSMAVDRIVPNIVRCIQCSESGGFVDVLFNKLRYANMDEMGKPHKHTIYVANSSKMAKQKPENMYGVIANSTGMKLFSVNAKVWVIDGWSGGGLENIKILGRACNKRWIVKWVAIKNVNNFRPAWVPPHITRKILKKAGFHRFAGTKEEMKIQSESLLKIHKKYFK